MSVDGDYDVEGTCWLNDIVTPLQYLLPLLIRMLFCWWIQVNAVRDGMSTIIPVPLLSLVTSQHLEQLVCGMPQVSIDVLKKVARFVSIVPTCIAVVFSWGSSETKGSLSACGVFRPWPVKM